MRAREYAFPLQKEKKGGEALSRPQGSANNLRR